jgi:hypothetical protein
MNEQLTEIIDTLSAKLGVASRFIITELAKYKIANHIVWLIIGSVLLFIAYKIFMIGVNKCREHNRKIDENNNIRMEYAKKQGRDLDLVYKESYDNIFEYDEYMVYWAIPLVICVVSIPMVIYGIFVIPWIIAPTGSTMSYLLEALK